MRRTSFIIILAAIIAVCALGCARQAELHSTEMATAPLAADVPTPTALTTLYFATTPKPTSTPTPTPTPTPSPSPTPSPTPAPTPFTIAWLSDTQYMAQTSKESIDAMADYILNDPHNRNITAVVHTGDVVDSYDEDWQWDNASSFEKIASELPTVVLAGNHDVNKYVSHERAYEYYANRPIITKWNEGCTLYQDGRASYRLISEGGCDFIIGAIGFDFDKAMMQWLRDAFLDHSDRVGILLAHSVLYNWQQFTPEGKMLNENIVIPCSNIRLVLCGHLGGIDYRTDERDEGQRQVTTMMFNPQYLYKRGYGYMRFLSFDPILRTVTASIYSPVFDSETFPDQKQELQCVIIENAF